MKTDRGHIFELTVQGISKITSDMEYQDLKFPILEARSNIRSLSKVNFPQSLGGRPVELLVGIKDPELLPKYVATLPTGLNVYKSVFTDVFGSNLIFGGQHPTFVSSPASTSVVMFLNTLRSQTPDMSPLLPDLQDQSLGFSKIFPRGQCQHVQNQPDGLVLHTAGTGLLFPRTPGCVERNLTTILC